ncbi:hypothetical protein [Streptomyces sp. NPDC127084]|uniref:hypothetical protein n=1 Tax=Streptomyces sp. NPDC127084 TaxID=3347133 RepID=UPI003653B608
MSATTVMTSRERAAAQAYLRLLSAVRAALTDPPGPPAPPVPSGSPASPSPLALTAPMAEADLALAAAGFAGNEAALFDLVTGLHGAGAGVRRRAARE